MRGRWRSLIIRVLVATFVAWIIAVAPMPRFPSQSWFAHIQVPIAIFLLICYIGKLMIDTFFYDRYKP